MKHRPISLTSRMRPLSSSSNLHPTKRNRPPHPTQRRGSPRPRNRNSSQDDSLGAAYTRKLPHHTHLDENIGERWMRDRATQWKARDSETPCPLRESRGIWELLTLRRKKNCSHLSLLKHFHFTCCYHECGDQAQRLVRHFRRNNKIVEHSHRFKSKE